MPTAVDKEGIEEEEVIVTTFDSESIHLVEPNIPLQSNSSDCGVFLLMYAASIVRLFPAGMTREELESNLTSTLSTEMFRDEHVLEFREYLQQLLFCLQFLEKNGLPEEHVKQEELETFTID
uniref:Ubiquitin-like protease family profile domain-containing protein n=1 Tax=Phytophthora ramorum TaxID=164328 RepID=H3GUK4_PHYRM